jgi:hypothetical protein
MASMAPRTAPGRTAVTPAGDAIASVRPLRTRSGLSAAVRGAAGTEGPEARRRRTAKDAKPGVVAKALSPLL